MSRGRKRKQSSRGWRSPKAPESVPGEAGVQRTERGPGWWKRIAVLAALAVVIPIVSLSACLVLARSGEPPGPPRAAIVDQLSLTFPNPAFVEEATDTLEEAGYVVDYHPGEEVTVDFYRGLPSHGYDLVIFRVHSARFRGEWRSVQVDLVELFTSEPYSEPKYAEEQKLGRLGIVRYDEGGDEYFGIGPRFVTGSMEGRFDGTTVLLMGCDGLSTEATAEAFIQKGAKSVISWSDLVSAGHTDAATERLLEHLLDGGLSVEEAVAQTMADVGPDPVYDSVLLSYPSEG